MDKTQTFSRFSLYGEEDGAIAPEFIHIEPISARSRRYAGVIAPHTHSGIFQLILLEKGSGWLSADGLAARLEPSALVAIPSGCIHAFDFAADAEGWVLSIASALVGELRIGERQPQRGSTFGAAVALASPLEAEPARRLSWLLVEMAADFARHGARQRSETTLAALALRLALSDEVLETGAGAPAMPGAAASRRDRLVQRFRALVDLHFREDWPVPRYAAALGTSPPSLSRACQTVLGRAPGDVVQDRRQLEAMRALTYTAASVKRIASDLGFADPAYFARFFKARTGITASRFRAERAWLKDSAPADLG